MMTVTLQVADINESPHLPRHYEAQQSMQRSKSAIMFDQSHQKLLYSPKRKWSIRDHRTQPNVQSQQSLVAKCNNQKSAENVSESPFLLTSFVPAENSSHHQQSTSLHPDNVSVDTDVTRSDLSLLSAK